MAKKAKAAKKPSAEEAIKNYLDRKVPRKVGSYWQPEKRLKSGEMDDDNPNNMCPHSRKLGDWCQECGDEYLASAL